MEELLTENQNLEEEVELDEDKIFVGKLGQMLDLPREIQLLDKNVVERIIDLIEPEEEFEVGYVNPVYFYKELWEELPIYKCTEMWGYTGIDFAWSKDDKNWANQAERVSAAKQQIATADRIEKETGQKPQDLHVSDTVYSKQNKLVKRYQTFDNPDDPDNPIKVDQNTILFYPIGRPKVCYFIKLPNRPDLDFIRVNSEQLEKYVYEQLDRIEDKMRVKAGQAKSKVHKYLQTADNWGNTASDIDRETRNDTDFDKSGKFIYKYNIDKSAVRALYTTQLYFLSSPVASTQGGRLVESLEEHLERNPFDLVFEDINAYGEILTEDKEETCCICGEPLNGYGNNPAPYKKSGLCCDACNAKFVIPARLAQLENPEENTEE